MSAQLPDVPPQLVDDTDELLTRLDATLANLSSFIERLRAATQENDEGAAP